MPLSQLRDLQANKPEQFLELISTLAKQQCDSLAIEGLIVDPKAMEDALVRSIKTIEL